MTVLELITLGVFIYILTRLLFASVKQLLVGFYNFLKGENNEE